MAIFNSYVCLPEGICRLQEFNILFYSLIICAFKFIYEPIYILSIIIKLKLRYITYVGDMGFVSSWEIPFVTIALQSWMRIPDSF